MAYKKGDPIAAADLNGFLASVRSLYGVGNGDRGYGQSSVLQNDVSVGSIIYALQWANLRSMIVTCSAHQGTTITNLPPASAFIAGQAIYAHESSAPSSNPYDFDSYVVAIDNNRLLSAPSSMTLSTSAFSMSRASPWTTSITGVFDVDFGSENAARYFFNTGGELRLRLVHPSGGTAKDADWRTMLSDTVGTMTLKARSFSISGTASGAVSNTGFYDIGAASTTLLNGQNLGTGDYSMNDFTVSASVLNKTGTNGGNGTGIRFTVMLDDAHTNSEGAETAIIAGTTLHVDVLRATFLAGITAPTFTTVTSFTASNAAPNWVTPAGSLGSMVGGASVSVQLQATDPEGGGLTYSLVGGTSLPPGLTMTSGGLISGTTPIVTTATNFPFSIAVTDGASASTRNFSFTLTALAPQTIQIPTSGDWTTPVGVDKIMFTWVVGGGGAGGSGHEMGNGGGGGGGGGGGFVHYQEVACVAGDVFSFVIGQGGYDTVLNYTDMTSSSDAQGGSTIVKKNGTPVITVTGGHSGYTGGPSYGNGGLGGSPNGLTGTNGTVGGNDFASSPGGAGAPGPLINALGGVGGSTGGGDARTGNSAGKSGVGYGSGGGGGGSKDRVGPGVWAGGPGQPGVVEFTFPSQGPVGGTLPRNDTSTGGGGDTGGGGGGGCCWDEALLPSGLKIGDAQVGDALLLMNPAGDGYYDYVVKSIRPAVQPCATIVTESGIELTCSLSTPIVIMRDGVARAFLFENLDLVGEVVPVLDNGVFRWETVVEVQDAGMLPVRLLSADNGIYAAGNEAGRYIFTHNAGGLDGGDGNEEKH